MRAIVLGAAAGGGFPQWNCACANCAGARSGRIAARARTQASLAVSGDGLCWLLLGASPDIGAQLRATPALWPRPPRRSPIAAVALPNGDLDAWLGLLSLRESTPFAIFSTAPVRRDLLHNPVMRTLGRFHGHTRLVELDAGARVALPGGLSLEAVPAPGKVPVHMVGRRAPDALDNVGFVVRDERQGKSLAWFPSVGGPTPSLERALEEADVVCFDGTFYRDDELQPLGGGRARDLMHWPVMESAEWLARFSAPAKWLVHVNNTNPLLVEDGAELRQLRARGIDVAWDGLEVTP